MKRHIRKELVNVLEVIEQIKKGERDWKEIHEELDGNGCNFNLFDSQIERIQFFRKGENDKETFLNMLNYFVTERECIQKATDLEIIKLIVYLEARFKTPEEVLNSLKEFYKKSPLANRNFVLSFYNLENNALYEYFRANLVNVLKYIEKLDSNAN